MTPLTQPLADKRSEQRKPCLVWLEGFDRVTGIPQFGSVCKYIYFLLFGTGAGIGLLECFTSDLYHSLFVLIQNYAVNMLE